MHAIDIPAFAYIFGFIGAALTVASFLMRNMLPLRLLALVASFFMVVYGYYAAMLPTLLLYVSMIFINAKKAWDIHKLNRAMEEARAEVPLKDWLVPHMKRRKVKAGTVLWRQGDPANEMVFLEKGSLRIQEYGEVLREGTLVGEIGIFARDNRRTLTLVCETDCILHRMTSEAMMQLYFLSPQLGFEVMRLVVARLQRDVETWRARAQAAVSPPAPALSAVTPAPAAAPTPAAKADEPSEPVTTTPPES